MRPDPRLLLLAFLTLATSARAEPARLLCTGLITDPTSHAQARQGGPFELQLDVAKNILVVDGAPAAITRVSPTSLSFDRTAEAPRGQVSKLTGKVGKSRDKLFGARAWSYELDRRTGFWKTRDASGMCRPVEGSPTLF